MEQSPAEDLLATTLAVAVPLRIMDLLRDSDHDAVQQSMYDQIPCLECNGGGCSSCDNAGHEERKHTMAKFIAAHGDDLLFPSKKRGDTAKVFNVLADALARMAFFPCGVEIFGMRFCENKEDAVYSKKLKKPLELGSLQEFAQRLKKPL